MNTINTKLIVDENEIVTLVADKTRDSEEIDQILIAFGNELAVLPFYAIYPADGRPAITLEGLVSESQFIEALKKDPHARRACRLKAVACPIQILLLMIRLT